MIDASNLQPTGNRTFILRDNSSSTTVNGTVKAHAFIPLIVIAVGLYVIEINACALVAIDTNAEVEYLEKTECPQHGKYVCLDCRSKMYELNFAGIFLGSVVTWGIALECLDFVTLIEYGLGIIDYADFINELTGGVLGEAFKTVDNALSDGCNDPNCIFYKEKHIDLTVKLNEPNEAYYKHVTPINAVISNTKYGNASSFKVTLYENTIPPSGGTTNFAPIETKTVSGLSGKNQTTVIFNWTPTQIGNYTFKVAVNSDNEVNETDESNNGDLGTIEVKYHLMKLQLYATTSLPSSNDPNQLVRLRIILKQSIQYFLVQVKEHQLLYIKQACLNIVLMVFRYFIRGEQCGIIIQTLKILTGHGIHVSLIHM